MKQIPMGRKSYDDPLGFDPTAKVSEHDTARESFEQAAAATFNLNAAFLRCFSTPDGETVLAFLRKNTLEAGTWMAGLAASNGIDAATAHGFAREGQNALVRDIMFRVESAATAKSPEDYIDLQQRKGSADG